MQDVKSDISINRVILYLLEKANEEAKKRDTHREGSPKWFEHQSAVVALSNAASGIAEMEKEHYVQESN